MPFNFPDPTVSTTATNPVTGASYQWSADPGKWVLTGGPAEAPNPPVTISLLPPEGPQKGDLWIHEETLIEYAWDGTQWFEVGSSCGGDSEEEEEVEDLYHPFVNSFKLVAPDDFNGDDGTATILTTAYDAGDDSYLSPTVQSVRFAAIDLNDRKLELAIEGDTIQLTPDKEPETGTKTLYGELEVTTVINSGTSIRYDVDYDSNRAVIYTEGGIVHYRIAPKDIYVKKTGDTMTGALVMDNAGEIEMQNTNLDFLITGESLKDVNGDPVLDSAGKEKWDTSIDRFSHIESLPPMILRSDGTYGGDTSAPFGVRVEIDDGNTHRNRFVVGNRNGDAVTVTGGTGPNVQFGTGFDGNQNPPNGRIDWEDGEEGGVKITGIPTPTKENPDSRLAVNKNYVDIQTDFLQNEIIELEEELEALAPSLERGTWRFNPTGSAGLGQFGFFALGTPIDEFPQVDTIFINSVDTTGTSHSFADVAVDSYVEVFDSADEDFGLYQINAINDETQGANSFWHFEVTKIRSNRLLADVDSASICRFKFFNLSEGADATAFVLKAGDTMTGQLQMGNVTSSTPNSTNSPKIMFDAKNSGGSRYNAYLYYDNNNYLLSTGSFRTKGSVASSGTFLAGTTGNSPTDYSPRMKLDANNGNLTWDYTSIFQWNNTALTAHKPIEFTNNAIATADDHAIHKGYVDDQIETLLARIEELENNSSSGGSAMGNNVKVELTTASWSPGFGEISTISSQAQGLTLVANGVTVLPRGRIHIVEKGANGATTPVFLFNITSVTKNPYSNLDADKWDIGVAQDAPGVMGAYSINERRTVIVSFLDGAASDDPAIGRATYTVDQSDIVNTNNASLVANNKAYNLDASGNLNNTVYQYGLFLPYDYLNSTPAKGSGFGVYRVTGLDENTTADFLNNTIPKEKVEERTINGIKGIAFWHYSYTRSNVEVQFNRIYIQHL